MARRWVKITMTPAVDWWFPSDPMTKTLQFPIVSNHHPAIWITLAASEGCDASSAAVVPLSESCDATLRNRDAPKTERSLSLIKMVGAYWCIDGSLPLCNIVVTPTHTINTPPRDSRTQAFGPLQIQLASRNSHAPLGSHSSHQLKFLPLGDCANSTHTSPLWLRALPSVFVVGF